jgi:hypothetical protein
MCFVCKWYAINCVCQLLFYNPYYGLKLFFVFINDNRFVLFYADNMTFCHKVDYACGYACNIRINSNIHYIKMTQYA